MGWVVTNWTYLEGRALRDGLIRNGSLLSYDSTLFLSYVELVIREFAPEDVDNLYLTDEDLTERRRSQIREAMEAFG